MRAGTAEIQPADGRFVAGPIQHGAHRKKLIKGELTVENMATCKTVNRFEVVRSDDLHMLNETGEIRSVLCESFDDRVAQIFAARVPVRFRLDDRFAVCRSAGKLEGSKLYVSRKDVFAFRRKRRIEKRRKRNFEIRR